MNYFELFLLSVGLCFDTFAVSLTGGICTKERLSVSRKVRIVLCFAVFQAGFALAGWLLGVSVMSYISRIDHWIAFVLLAYIGVKMIVEGCGGGKGDEDCGRMSLADNRQLVLLSVATSIDAVAVGISLAVVDIAVAKALSGLAMVFAVTAAASVAGLSGGRRLGIKFGEKSEIAGGVILICIGIKILLEHLF